MAAGGWTLAVHGGAGAMCRASLAASADRAARAGLERALAAGAAQLADGQPAVAAVEAAIRILEDDPHFNAGRGAALTAEGRVELDAAIMEGADRRAGAVAGVATVRHPITLARAVMETTPHLLLAGHGAEAFARATGQPTVGPDYFETPERRQQLEALLASGAAFDAGLKYGTVGAVARDAQGRLAAGTSTGGLTGKRWGRIGDTPLIGAGTFADDRGCAVSATGTGEAFIRAVAAHSISSRVARGEPLAAAAAAVLADVGSLGGVGGVIALGAEGAPVTAFTTRGMYRGWASDRRAPLVAIYDDEEASTSG